MTVIQFLLLFDREGPPPVDELGVHLLLGIPLCLALIVVTRLRNKGFTAPRLAVSGALIVLSACITTIVYIPQILPGWRTAIGGRETPQGGFPAPVWMSLLIAMLVVSLIAVALTYVRRPEALGVPVEHEGHQ
jgi:hypothetical protein